MQTVALSERYCMTLVLACSVHIGTKEKLFRGQLEVELRSD